MAGTSAEAAVSKRLNEKRGAMALIDEIRKGDSRLTTSCPYGVHDFDLDHPLFKTCVRCGAVYIRGKDGW